MLNVVPDYGIRTVDPPVILAFGFEYHVGLFDIPTDPVVIVIHISINFRNIFGQ